MTVALIVGFGLAGMFVIRLMVGGRRNHVIAENDVVGYYCLRCTLLAGRDIL